VYLDHVYPIVGHFLLTYLLLERLVSSAPSRIVTLSSKGHRYGKLELDDVQFKRRWSTLKAYCCSKTENVLFSTHLARLLQGSLHCVCRSFSAMRSLNKKLIYREQVALGIV